MLLQDDGRRTSVSEWDDDTSLHAWKDNPGFRERIAPVRELCDEVLTGGFNLAAAFSAPSSSPRLKPPGDGSVRGHF